MVGCYHCRYPLAHWNTRKVMLMHAYFFIYKRVGVKRIERWISNPFGRPCFYVCEEKMETCSQRVIVVHTCYKTIQTFWKSLTKTSFPTVHSLSPFGYSENFWIPSFPIHLYVIFIYQIVLGYLMHITFRQQSFSSHNNALMQRAKMYCKIAPIYASPLSYPPCPFCCKQLHYHNCCFMYYIVMVCYNFRQEQFHEWKCSSSLRIISWHVNKNNAKE